MKPLLLVVDDDEAIRGVIAGVLRDDGRHVVCASDGDEALEVMRHGPTPDLVLLDLMMPRVNGWQVLERMSENPLWSDVPVVVLTAFDDRDDLPAGRHVLHKPMEPPLLLQTVRALLEDTGREAAP